MTAFTNTKKEPSFNRAHFTEGTVALFEDSRAPYGPDGNRQLTEFTVDTVVNNGPDSWCITDKYLKCEVLPDQPRSIHISWCRKILKRPNTAVKYERLKNTVEVFFEEYPCDRQKHHSHYAISRPYQFISALATDLFGQNPDHLYDFEAIMQAITNDPSYIATAQVDPDRPWAVVHYINKKKFKRLLKRIAPRCRIKRRAEQREQDRWLYDNFDPIGDWEDQ